MEDPSPPAGPPCIRCSTETKPLPLGHDSYRHSDVRLFACPACGFVTPYEIKRYTPRD